MPRGDVLIVAVGLALVLVIDFAFEEAMRRRRARGALEPYKRDRDGGR